ncbi:MAG: DNA polymerase/3'-5' exonuclease PolX [Candidatus Atribacteria bacterium]|nr:DNA polymerase/3'-5' exonuclease PolX [Candidatus Atribacteria bacterium]
MVKNAELAYIFGNITKILKIQNDNVFKIRAYERVADTLENMPMEAETLYKSGRLNEIPGVGTAIAQKIGELIETGRLEYYEKLKEKIPAGVLELLNIPDIGPRKAKLFYEELGIDSVEKLEKAALAHQLQSLYGMGKKAEENILRGIELYKRREQRSPLGIALPIAEEIVRELKSLPCVDQISIAGSLRRGKDTIKDIDILISSLKPEKIMEKFINLPQTKEVLAEGLTKSAILTKQNMQVDLRVVSPDSFGTALLYFTGSQAHNVRLREMAVKRGLKINEYGIFQVKGDKKIGGDDENEIYEILGLHYIMPELREDMGEFEAARHSTLPIPVELNDIKGDLHTHTDYSDGLNSIKEMAAAAKQRGYQYIAVTDHSQSLHIAGGLDEVKLLEQIKRINEINRDIEGITVLKGIEVDIKSDGSLDISDDILKKLDIVIAAVHSNLKQKRALLTERYRRAMENPYVDIIAHPTGRIIGYREPFDIDIQEIIRIAARTKTALEINSSPERMDLHDIYVKSAKEQSVMLAIGTDAHQTSSLDQMRYGLAIARRGWLEKANLLNTLSLKKLKERLKKK